MTVLLKIEINQDYLINAATAFAGIALGILGFIILYLIIFLRRKKKYAHLEYLYSNFLSEIILCDTGEETQLVLNKSYVKRIVDYWIPQAFARELLITHIVRAKRSVSGQAGENLISLYEKLGFPEDSMRRLRSRHWQVKARAIQELAAMEQHEYLTKIYRLTNSGNGFVRKEAQTGIVKLTGIEGLRFLNVLSHPMSEWQQICLLEQLPDHADIPLKNYESWLASNNHSVVEFTVSLAGKYQVYSLNEKIISLLTFPAEPVRRRAARTLIDLNHESTAASLAMIYSSCDLSTRLMVLDILEQTAGAEQVPFISQLLSSSHDQIKIRANELMLRLQGGSRG